VKFCQQADVLKSSNKVVVEVDNLQVQRIGSELAGRNGARCKSLAQFAARSQIRARPS